jgi:WD40 repeat protein
MHVSLAAVLRGHESGVSEVRFAPDGALLASTDDRVLALWDVTGHTRRWVLEIPAGNITFSPRGDLLAYTTLQGVVHLRTLDGNLLAELPRHAPLATSVAFSPDGAWVLTGSSHGDVRIWELATRHLLVEFHATPGAKVYEGHPDTQAVRDIAFAPDGARLAMGSRDVRGCVQLWAVDRNPPAVTWKAAALHPRHVVWDLRGSPNGQHLAAANSDDHAVDLLQFELLESVGQLAVRQNGRLDVPLAVAFSPDGSLLAVAAGAGTMFIWDLQTGQIATQIAAHTDGYGDHTNVMEWPIGGIDWSPAGNLIATTGLSHATNFDPATRQFTGPDDYTIKLWEVQTDA